MYTTIIIIQQIIALGEFTQRLSGFAFTLAFFFMQQMIGAILGFLYAGLNSKHYLTWRCLPFLLP